MGDDSAPHTGRPQPDNAIAAASASASASADETTELDDARDLHRSTVRIDPTGDPMRIIPASSEPPPIATAHSRWTTPHDGRLDSPSAYVLREEVGCGAFGRVCIARQLPLKRDVAIKQLQDPTSQRQRQFLHEAQITARLQHPNIIPIHDGGPDHMVMKLISGRDLAELIAAHPDDILRHVEILIQICNAVIFAHARNVIHRDIKADNIMVGAFGEVLLVDWGLAVELRGQGLPARSRSCETETMVCCGTPACLAPEVAAGNRAAVGKPTDVYLLAAVLYQILTGEMPFDHGGSVQKCLALALENRYRRVSHRNPRAPRRLISIQRRVMEAPPSRRPSALAFQRSLREWLLISENERSGEHWLAEARRHVELARQAHARRQPAPYEEYILGLECFDRVLHLLPDAREAMIERQAAVADFIALAREHEDSLLCRLLDAGLRPPRVDKDASGPFPRASS
ncbi:MAG: serine/threonine-protein kinase [Planctomycetota bacterium]